MFISIRHLRTRKWVLIVASASIATILCACAWYGPGLSGPNMPQSTDVQLPPAQPQPHQQEILSSARHWELVAGDVAQGLCDTTFSERCDPRHDSPTPCDPKSDPQKCEPQHPSWTSGDRAETAAAPKPASVDQKSTPPATLEPASSTPESRPTTQHCVKMAFGPGEKSPGVFPSVFRNSVIRELLARRVDVYTPDSPTDCDRIEIHATVVKLTGSRRTPYYVGQYAALAQGIVAVRNVARNVSTAVVAPTILGGEIAYWLSPNYLTRHPMAEVSIAVSRVTVAGRYISEYTNVYYIDARDVDAYATTAKGATGDIALTSPLPESPPHLTEVSLPTLTGPQKVDAKVSFSGKKQFRTAGSVLSYLVGATADGSKVVGNTKFYDNRWHVATMSATGGAVDLGVMGGDQACATAISDDGKVIVGLAQLAAGKMLEPVSAANLAAAETGCSPKADDKWSAFKWTQQSDGSAIATELGTGSYPDGSVTQVLVSGDGTTIAATVVTPGPNKKPIGHIVRWKSSDATDSFKSAWKGHTCDSGTSPTCSCALEGVSQDGTLIGFACWPIGQPDKQKHSVFTEKGNEDADPACPKNTFCDPHLSPEPATIVALSNDFRIAVVSVKPGAWRVSRRTDSKVGGPSWVPMQLKPTGLSADGRIVVGYMTVDLQPPPAPPPPGTTTSANKPPPPPTFAAAVWYASNGTVGSPVEVFQPGSFDTDTDTDAKKGDCAFVVGDYANGTLLLVNEVVTSANCKPGNGSAAWVIGP